MVSSDISNVSPAILVDGARVAYGSNVVLDDVSFSVPAGSLAGIVGPNGAGKSTLLKVLVGIVQLDAGIAMLNGMDPIKARGTVSYIPQTESVNWSFPVSVYDVVMMGRTVQIGLFRFPSKRDRKIVEDALEVVGLGHRRNDLLSELSGGQRQRVFVARSLAQEAKVLLLDEAFSGVDVGSQTELVDVLRLLCSDGCTVLLVTHDLTKLACSFDCVVCLNVHVCACGKPEDAFTPDVLAELYGAHRAAFVNMR